MPVRDLAADFVAYDDEGRVLLLAEAKSRGGTSAEWAAQYRRNLLAHGVLPAAQFFMIATPEQIYIWKQEDQQPHDEMPTFTIDAAQEFGPYFEQLGISPSDIAPQAFELMILFWLTEIALSGEERASRDPAARLLAELGLLGPLSKARIEMSSAA